MEVLGQKIEKAVEQGEWKAVTASRNGPKISHLFFVDDLLLMGVASFSQACMMEHLVADFCGISGQQVNCGMSRIWFSPNTPTYLKHSICLEFGVLATMDLGKYLGVPLIHRRKVKKHYQYLLERVQHKMVS